MRAKRWIGLGLTCVLLGSSLAGCGNVAETTTEQEKSSEQDQEGKVSSSATGDAWTLAETTTYEPYPETVEFSVGVRVRADVAYPEGSADTAENSAFTRFMKAKLNIQSKDAFEAVDDVDYETKTNLAIASGEIPDIINVTYDQFRDLIENDMLEDLTDAYNNCAGDLMKEIYASGNNASLDMATVDGKLYGIPTTSISQGPEMIWLRGDWMDALGLSEPKTMEDVENIVKEFIEKDPGNNGAGNTVGIPLCIEGNNFIYDERTAGAYRANNIFGMNHAYPMQWIDDGTGKAVYGSIQPEMKESLTLLADWYKKGIIDQQFAVRSYDEIRSMINDGRCGSYFCYWWAPYDSAGSYELNKDAEWRAYCIAGSDGKVSVANKDPNQNYFVVRKGFEHPELLVKAKSLTLDYNQGTSGYTDTSAEAQEYMNYVVNGYGVEIIGGFDWFDAAERSYVHIKEAMEGTRSAQDMTNYENQLYQSCVAYLDSVEKGEYPDKSNWIDYQCRVVACKKILETPMNIIQPLYYGETPSMTYMWEDMKKLEKTTMMKIIQNEAPVDEFDNFVAEWNKIGGEIITQEVNDAIN